MVAAISGEAVAINRQTALPGPLSDGDVTHYRAAFALQDHGHWQAADREIAQIEQPVLLGHLLAQRYLSATYRSGADELIDWMNRWSDLPEASQIYTMARQKAGPRASLVKVPARPAMTMSIPSGPGDDPMFDGLPDTTLHGRAYSLAGQIRALLRSDRTARAEAMIEAAEESRAVSAADIDQLKSLLAVAYFGDGRDHDALRWAEQAADRSGLAEAHWVAGLATWRIGDHAGAAAHFEAVANTAHPSPWLASASAFWAARANMAGRRPEVVNHWLRQAAAFPRTFYGLLARRALGQDVEYSWDSRRFTSGDVEILRRVPSAQRALALLQLDDKTRAEDELRQLLPAAGPALTSALLALANEAELPGLAIEVADVASQRNGQIQDGAQYPVPEWQPKGGWTVDKALILAIARQESSFNPNARGRSGAVGLMQVMPATARSLGAKGKLNDPAVNLEVGQRYVRRLLADDRINGNLMVFAASYNVGPAAVARWTEVNPSEDALLFMESIPYPQTRMFVQRVLTNYWTYRNRFGQSSPSLNTVASGSWPLYDGPEHALREARHIEN